MCKDRFSKLIGILSSAVLLMSCSQEKQEAEPIIRPVRYQQVFATGGSRIRTFSGTTQAGLESSLSFKVPGTVRNVLVKVGDTVRKGQLIAEIAPRDYELQVQEAEAALEQALAQVRNTKAQYERVQELYANRTVSKKDLDAARATYESADAAVRSVEKRLELAQLQVKYTRLMAPVKGSIAEVSVDVNENVAAGQAIVKLTSGAYPEVKVTIPEVMIAQVQAGITASVTFDALPGKTFEATVTEVGVTPTGFVTTFPVTLRLKEAAPEIRPGMAAEVSFRIETGSTRECILVPPVSVGEDRQGRHVFIVEPGDEGLGVVRRRDVRIGELTSDGLEILEGLLERELVVTAGVTRLTDGQKVKTF